MGIVSTYFKIRLPSFSSQSLQVLKNSFIWRNCPPARCSLRLTYSFPFMSLLDRTMPHQCRCRTSVLIEVWNPRNSEDKQNHASVPSNKPSTGPFLKHQIGRRLLRPFRRPMPVRAARATDVIKPIHYVIRSPWKTCPLFDSGLAMQKFGWIQRVPNSGNNTRHEPFNSTILFTIFDRWWALAPEYVPHLGYMNLPQSRTPSLSAGCFC